MITHPHIVLRAYGVVLFSLPLIMSLPEVWWLCDSVKWFVACQLLTMCSLPSHLPCCDLLCFCPFLEAEELYQKRVLTITGICIALLVVGIMCVVAYCKTK